ncbi:MAG: GNAT family N-acetyltransferase [Victivallaceae bacterium]|nr:GNAT family N-acetyltransferase [Victivallaceae bacterium]
MTGEFIRPMVRNDRDVLLRMVRGTGMFTPEEVDIAAELMDVYLDRPDQKDYRLFVADDGTGTAVGYVCFGPTPATKSTFDLYWIVVEPVRQHCGIGGRLLAFAEQTCHRSGGRLIIIETSSLEKYEPTRKFYLRNGYSIEARIKNFYAPDDDRLIFTRRLPDILSKVYSKDR